MIFLLDTHLLVWMSVAPKRLSKATRDRIEDRDSELVFSAVSIWEVAIKHALNKPDFTVPPRVLHRGLIARGYRELAMTSEHGMEVANLPPIHGDPFDRILLAQARVEGIILLTSDTDVAKYPGPARLV